MSERTEQAHWIQVADSEVQLFAWTHFPPPGFRRNTGVMLVSPVGPSYLHSHRAVRHLARTLAARGFVVVRHDHYGTGNSSGDPVDADTYARWQLGLETARAHLLRVPGVEQVAVISLSSGSLVAQPFLENCDSAAVVHWFPYLKGNQFVRDLEIIDGLLHLESPSASYAEGGGYPMHEATLQALRDRDLLGERQPKTKRTLVINDDGSPQNTRLAKRLRDADIVVEQRDMPGLGAMMRQAELMEVPQESIDAIVSWLAIECDGVAATEGGVTLATEYEGVGVHKTALHIATPSPMFGILSEPSGGESDLLVVLLNAGAAHHVGANRLHVDLARMLVARGSRALRLDLSHLGDSAREISPGSQHPYASSAASDVLSVLREIKRSHRYRRFILVGLCSGAHNAFQAARMERDEGIVGLILLNPLTFEWHDGDDLLQPEATRLEANATQFQKSFRDPQKWLRLFMDSARLRRVGGAVVSIGLTKVQRLARAIGRRLNLPVGTPLERDLMAMLKAGKRISVLSAASEPGYRTLHGEVGHLLTDHAQVERVYVDLLQDSDHTFSSRASRQDLIARIIKHVLEFCA